MKSEDINFPLYRKYKNNKSYFKILDERNFEELQIIGTKVVLHKIRAISFPEINFIHDLIFNYLEMADDIDAKDFEEVKQKV
ncbi:MAG: hypothetical protein WCR21_04060 [Bacteroidota bacterium]